MKLLKLGNKIPNFNLIDQDKLSINSDSLTRKSMLIYFYPKAITAERIVQSCRLQDNINIFKKLLDIEIIRISSDRPKNY